ncbi:MAG: HPP family protein, partial [Promethearchaeia archaeon]
GGGAGRQPPGVPISAILRLPTQHTGQHAATKPDSVASANKGPEERAGRPEGLRSSDLQQYYLDARQADRQQIDNVKTLQGILDAVTQCTRFVTAELWTVHDGNAPAAVPRGNKVSPASMELEEGDLESGQGQFGVHLSHSGLRASSSSFLANAEAGPLGETARKNFENLERLNDVASLRTGEGLEGEALERGDMELNIMEDYIANPERQVTDRAGLAASLYAASLAVPIRQTDQSSKIVAMLMLFLPKDGACTGHAPHTYLDRHASPVMLYVETAARILSAELHKQTLLDEYHRLRLSIKFTVKERAQHCWSRTRVIVRMGALRSKTASKSSPPQTPLVLLRKWLANYTGKFCGGNGQPPPRADWTSTAWTFIGVFLGILVPAAINHFALAANKSEFTLMMGSFGALATLLYAAPASPFAQPRMVIMGHVVALVVSISVDYLVINPLTGGAEASVRDFSSTQFIPKWLATALVPALSISAMAKLGCINPPAAAASIIYLAGGRQVKNLQWLYIFMPTLLGCAIMIFVAILVNNLSSRRKFPQFW